jgi:hypothetical protein
MYGRLDLRREVVVYGLICAALMNLPFGLGLLFARHVPPTELAIIMSLAPFCNYLVALLTGRDNPVPRKLLAIAVGFASSAILILSREGTMSGRLSWWMIASFSGPIMYTAYNWYAAANWPKDAGTISVGAVESVASGLIVLPLLLAVAPPWAADIPAMLAYWSVLAATVMWIAERIAFFTLIRDKGAVYTIQAIYLATPAAVIFAAIFRRCLRCLAVATLSILMVALWPTIPEPPNRAPRSQDLPARASPAHCIRQAPTRLWADSCGPDRRSAPGRPPPPPAGARREPAPPVPFRRRDRQPERHRRKAAARRGDRRG